MTTRTQTIAARLRDFDTCTLGNERFKLLSRAGDMGIVSDFIADICDCWDYHETYPTVEGFMRHCNMLADILEDKE